MVHIEMRSSGTGTGTGTVKSVQSKLPDGAGNVALVESDFPDIQTDLSNKLNITDLLATALLQFGALMIPVQYNAAGSAWPAISSTLLNNAAIGFHWIGGDAGHAPPGNSGPAVWDRAS